jgi:DNA-binding NtrC family response regulator
MRQMPTCAEHVPTLAEIERRHILQTLALCGYFRTHTATLLGISIRCLRLKLHQYELSDHVHEPPPPKLNEEVSNP